MFPPEALTRDGFLGGRVQALQPRDGYRAAMDPVLLAAACRAQAGETVLELGCGVGVASLCLSARVPGLRITGVERQAAYAELARQNAADNGAPLEVVEADLAALPDELRARSFDHVIANPPYFAPHSGTPARDAGREAALREETPLALWLEIGLRRLRPGGWLSVIHMAERLPELLNSLHNHKASIVVLPIAARRGRAAGRVILQARKGGRAPFTLLPPFLLHQGDRHEGDADSHTEAARAVLRDGAALPMGSVAFSLKG